MLILGRFSQRWRNNRALLPFQAAAKGLYEETKGADQALSFGQEPPSLSICLDYHARQLINHAKYGKVTLWGVKTGSSTAEPIKQSDLWAGGISNDMSRWVTNAGIEYAGLSVPRSDLRQIIEFVRRSVRDHDALMAWCRGHTPSMRM